MNGVTVVDFESLDRELEAAGAELPTAEVHGLLSGLACVPGGRRVALVQGEALGTRVDAPEAVRGLDVLEIAWDHTAQALDSMDMEFTPTLPDDEEPLSDRTQALGEWCTGFLAGLGLAGIGDFDGTFSGDALEFLADLREMSQIEADMEADSEAERAYAELVEYMRVGVLLVREELDALGPNAVSRQLH